ncbi:MAG: cyclic nucleotide-binding domain-containing protein [Anaerolineales bacterium]|jgi:CRP/FNR family cyclic AMP-dependent transcriptional regulator|nr:MAG: cyclic nucleotide-binding domain-containing protein [Anaerolineales bacterium]
MVSPELLRRFPFFAGLTEEELKSIAMISEEEKYEANTFIFRERGKADKLFVLIEGTVDIKVNTDEEGLQHETVSTLTHGDIFCWSAVVEPQTLTASAYADTPVTVVAIDGAGLRAMFELDCHLGYRILQKSAEIISSRLKDTRIQMLSLVPK